MTPAAARAAARRNLWVIPVLVLVAAWAIVPPLTHIPAYKLPRLASVGTAFWRILTDGTLPEAVAASLIRLAIAFVIGAGLGLAVGLLMATSRWVTFFVEPVVAFFQAVAGIAWIPLAIVWFGFGDGPVIFVVANAVFFIVVYNTILGVQTIQPVLFSALRTLGATPWQLVLDVVVPGAMVSVLAGLRTGLAFGWRALIAVELIAANTGTGYLLLSAAQNYEGDVVVVTIIVVGALWIAIDRFLLRPLERRTIVRWGMVTPGQARWP